MKATLILSLMERIALFKANLTLYMHVPLHIHLLLIDNALRRVGFTSPPWLKVE